MSYPYRKRRQPYQTRAERKPAHPQFVFAGCHLAPGFDPYNHGIWVAPEVSYTALVTALYQSDSRLLIVPANADAKDSGQIIGKQRHGRGDRLVWQVPNGIICIYTTLLTDVTNAATRYFTPASITMLAAGKSTGNAMLDQLVPYAQTIANFCDGILALFERGCQAKSCNCTVVNCNHPTILNIDAVEGDYAKMQKLLALIERGATVGERESAVRRVEEQVGKLYLKVTSNGN